MPNFEFKCEKCGHVHNEIRTIVDRNKPAECPKCGAPSNKIVSDYSFTVNIK